MMTLGLTETLRILAERRRDYPLHGDSLDACARGAICAAVPPTAKLPSPNRSDGPSQESAREAWEQVYRELCGLK